MKNEENNLESKLIEIFFIALLKLELTFISNDQHKTIINKSVLFRTFTLNL